MLTKDEMYDLYFNKGYVIAVRLEEFGAFVGDLIDRHQIIFYSEAQNLYKCAKRTVEENEDNDPVVYAIYFRERLTGSTWLCDRETINKYREVILYSAQDTVKNIKLRIAEQEQKIKANNNAIKSCKAKIKELYGIIGELRCENTSIYVDGVLKDESRLKQYGVD